MNSKLIYIYLAMFVTIAVTGQTKQQAEKWLVNNWKVQYLFENGKKEVPGKGHENDGIIFQKNFAFTMLQEGQQLNGKWKYDQAKKQLELNIASVGIKTKLKVLKLTAVEFVYETKYDDGTVFKYHMAPKIKAK